MWEYQTLPVEKIQHVVGYVAVACGVMVGGRKGDVRVIGVEGMVETMRLEEISKEKSTSSEENNENGLLCRRQMHLGDKISKKRIKVRKRLKTNSFILWLWLRVKLKGKKIPYKRHNC